MFFFLWYGGANRCVTVTEFFGVQEEKYDFPEKKRRSECFSSLNRSHVAKIAAENTENHG